jgi:two-component system chemotaxis response regulator CheV
LVVEAFGGLMGLLVASVTRIRRVSSDEIVPPQVSAFSGVRGLFLDENRRFVFFLDVEKALAEISFAQTTRASQWNGSDTSNHPSILMAENCKPVIVVVDESARARAKTIEFLRPYPVEVIESRNGNEAFRECRRLNQQRRNFIVFSELDLPDMDGFSFVRNLRRIDEFADIPMFLYGNFICDSEKHRALAAGADSAVGKFDKMHLQAVISAYLDVVMAKEEVRQVS